MAKLIGTDPNQVPTNADLGTMAYQDAERPALGQTLVKSAGTALIVERTGDATNLQFKADGQNVGHIYGFKNGSGGDLAFYPTNSSGVITQRMKIGRDGDVSILDGNLVLANGHGIDFSATSNGSGSTSSELLDDYEEGTFTGTLSGSVSGSFTQSNTKCFYTKVGRMVSLSMMIQWSANTTTGQVRITNLPFVVLNTDAGYRAAASIGYVNGADVDAANFRQLIGTTSGNSSQIDFFLLNDNGPPYTSSSWSSSGEVQVSITYFTNS